MEGHNDSYILLAHHLISISGPAEINRLLRDDEYIYKKIINEVRGQDFSGPFLDCIICSLLEGKKRMEMCRELDKLARYFFGCLDLKLLREKIVEYCTLYNL